MTKIDKVKLRCMDPEAQRRFYSDILGMQRFDDGTVGYGDAQARLEFTQASEPYHPGPHDRYWKIALAIPDIALACRQLASFGVETGAPIQFKDIGYLAHFKDPEGFTIELIDHAFDGEQSAGHIDKTKLGGGAHLNLLTLRTENIEVMRGACTAWGMVPLSIQPVDGYGFTLYFFAFTNDVPPDCNNLHAVENRPWLYQRPYTVLEFQYLHEQPVIETDTGDSAGYAGFTISNGVDIKEIACDFEL